MTDHNDANNSGDTGEQINKNKNANKDAISEHMIPKSRFDEVMQQRRDAITAVDNVIINLTEQIPEDLKSLVPNLPPTEKLKWLQSALKKNLFGSQQTKEGLDTKRPNNQKPKDFSGMNPIELIEHGLKNPKK